MLWRRAVTRGRYIARVAVCELLVTEEAAVLTDKEFFLRTETVSAVHCSLSHAAL